MHVHITYLFHTKGRDFLEITKREGGVWPNLGFRVDILL